MKLALWVLNSFRVIIIEFVSSPLVAGVKQKLANKIKKFDNNFEVFITFPKSLLFIPFVYNEQ